jgi:hypothetical protein
MRGIAILFVSLGCIACTKSSDDKPSASAPPPATGSGSAAIASRVRGEQVKPPVDVKTPPADAT